MSKALWCQRFGAKGHMLHRLSTCCIAALMHLALANETLQDAASRIEAHSALGSTLLCTLQCSGLYTH